MKTHTLYSSLLDSEKALSKPEILSAVDAQTMQAAISTRYGGPEIFEIQRVPKPQPKENEILVKIHATSVTAAQTAIRTGFPLIGRLFMGLTKPKNPISGTDFAGEIVEIGAEVKKFKVGDKVFGMTDIEGGGYAEYLSITEEAMILPIPSTYSYQEASAILDGGSTAYAFLTSVANLQPSMKILINGASGSIGTAAVQIAKLMGAEVTGVCSTRNVEMVRGLGADFVIDYKQEDFTQNGQSYDILFDTVGKSSFSKAKDSLKAHGQYLSPVLALHTLKDMIITGMRKGKKVRFEATGLRKEGIKMAEFIQLHKLMESGKLRPVVDRVYHLTQVVEAHRYVDTGHKRGNVVMSMDTE